MNEQDGVQPAHTPAQEQSAARKSHKQLMKRFRRAKVIPAAEDVERFSPDPDTGLSDEQVEQRFSQMLFNDVNKKYSKSYTSIFVGNICTVFNFLCLIVALALAYAGAELSQFLFVAIFAANLYERLGFPVFPDGSQSRHDIIQAVTLGTPERLVAAMMGMTGGSESAERKEAVQP